MNGIVTIPNVLTALRIVLVPSLITFLWDGNFRAALTVFLVAGVSDALDGFIARRFNQQSRLGSFLDPLADKLLVVTSSLVLAAIGRLPWWLALVIVGRDMIIVSGAVAYYTRTGTLEMEPRISSKTNTFVQIALILAVLAHGAGLEVPGGVLKPFFVLTLVMSLVSGGEYVMVWGRRAFGKN